MSTEPILSFDILFFIILAVFAFILGKASIPSEKQQKNQDLIDHRVLIFTNLTQRYGPESSILLKSKRLLREEKIIVV